MRELGLDLAAHLSRALHPADIAAADIILVMEPRHQQEVRCITDTAAGILPPLLLLGLFAERNSAHIADPYGGSLDAYRASRQHIQESVAGFVAAALLRCGRGRNDERGRGDRQATR